LHARVLARHRLADNDYRLSQLRYDLAKLRAKGMVERLGRTRRYHLTPRATLHSTRSTPPWTTSAPLSASNAQREPDFRYRGSENLAT